jgi:hypothetical protein
LRTPNAVLNYQASVQGAYQNGSVVQNALGKNAMHTDTLPGVVSIDPSYISGQIGIVTPQSGHLFATKTAPARATEGHDFPYIITYGNSGSVALKSVTVAIQIPYNTEIVTSLTSPGYKKVGSIVSWVDDTVPVHSALAKVLMVRPKTGSFSIIENSCYVGPTNPKDVALNFLPIVPGPVVTEVSSKPLQEIAWQFFGHIMDAIAANVLHKGPAPVQDIIDQIDPGAVHTSARGIDLIITGNGTLIGQLGGGNVVAQGGGNVVAQGGGNVVAQGAGNIVAQGAGNAISVPGIGFLNQSNLYQVVSNIVAAGGGNIALAQGANIVAAGAGNLISNDGGTLIGLDGNPFKDNGGNGVFLHPQIPGIVAAGAGNVVAQGGGNIVAAGAGNLIGQDGSGVVAQGAGNIVAQGAGNLLANGDGFVTIANKAGIVAAGAGNVIGPKIAAGVVAPGASLTQGSNVLTNNLTGVLSNDSASIVAQGAGN